MLPSGPNVNRLIALYATRLLVAEHGDTFEAVVASMFSSNLKPKLRIAERWVEKAIDAIRASPSSEHHDSDCEVVAGELLRRLAEAGIASRR
jgi:hypothetical protein